MQEAMYRHERHVPFMVDAKGGESCELLGMARDVPAEVRGYSESGR